MTAQEALAEAKKFYDEYGGTFTDDTHMLAAAILWGERHGQQQMRDIGLAALNEARAKMRVTP